jgi:4-hydroxy-3-polyprenylbenzoate decarboxylase
MYKSLRACAEDLEKNGMLVRIPFEVDPYLEAAEIHRRYYDAKGPAILFEKVKGSPFQAISNIYGTNERTEFIFRKTIPSVKKVIELKVDPMRALKRPFHYFSSAFTALKALPQKSIFQKPAQYGTTQIDQLPQIVSWPMDGGPFVLLPQVISFPPGTKKAMKSNIGMYRIQLGGNDYIQNKEIGMHYQLHRGIGNHHTAYNASDEPFRVSIAIGGPPSFAFSAIMPLPEQISEMTFAGMLGGRRYRYAFDGNGHIVPSDADFVITGTIVKNKKKPEGPFGDHLGYYSLQHDFPYLEVDNVYHRKDPLWHFTVVGRPPQEDSGFGYLIHKLVEELAPQEFPGLKELNAVDAAGVHPLLIAIGYERYMPFRKQQPEEILTIANRILGSGQTSLAKFLFIAAGNDHPDLNTHDIASYFDHFLRRVDWTRDLHFQTKTTIDTLDYSGDGWNTGSKVVIACNGPELRELGNELPTNLNLPSSATDISLALPGVLAITLSSFTDARKAKEEMDELSAYCKDQNLDNYPLIIVCDDASFTAAELNNFLWVSFTRANPSHDIYGVGSETVNKHWGCTGSLIIDARIKPHHAPELVRDKKVAEKVDKYFSKGGALYKYKPHYMV